MKKLATTFGLLALMLIVTSFTTPTTNQIGGSKTPLDTGLAIGGSKTPLDTGLAIGGSKTPTDNL